MNKKQVIICLFLSSLFIGLVVVGNYANNQVLASYDWDAEDYEDEIGVWELDLFVNGTGLMPMSVDGIEGKSFMCHGRIAYGSRKTISNLYGEDIFTSKDFFFDSNIQFIGTSDILSYRELDLELLAQGVQDPFSNEITVKASTEDNDDYTGIGNAETEEAYMMTEEELLKDDDTLDYSYLYNYSAEIGDTSMPSLTDDQIAMDTDSEFNGVVYTAGDGSSIIDYGRGIVESLGGTYDCIHNASIIGWSMDEEMTNNIALTFEDVTSGSPMSPQTITTTRHSLGIFKRIRDNIREKGRVIRNHFKKIPRSRVITGIRRVPSQAISYTKKKVGSAWHNLKAGLKSMAGKITDMVKKIGGWIWGILGGALGVALIGLAAFLIIRNKDKIKKIGK